jgi:hypothetical protein
MAKKTKKMAFGGPTGPMDNRPAMQSSGNSKAGAGQSVKQDGDRPGRQFGPMRGNDRGENVRGGNRPGMGRPGMVRPGFPSGGPMNPATPPRVLPTPDLSSGAAVQPSPERFPTGIDQGALAQAQAQRLLEGSTNVKTVGGGPSPMMSPANIKFANQQGYDDYVKRYNESMAATGGKPFSPGYAKGGAVKSKKMASGGMAKGSSGGRGWGMARGGKSAKVC